MVEQTECSKNWQRLDIATLEVDEVIDKLAEREPPKNDYEEPVVATPLPNELVVTTPSPIEPV